MNLVVVICRNGRDLTKKCIPTLLSQTIPTTILLLDNASRDGTSSWARAESHKHWGRMVVASFPFPLSVSELWNVGMAHAKDWGCTEAMIVNNDTEFLPETFDTLSKWMAGSPDLGLVSCIVNWGDMKYDKLEEIPHPCFSAFLMKVSAWEAIGGFDENCKIAHVEDCCAHVELHRCGIRAVSISLPFVHHVASTIRHSDKEEADRIAKAAENNREYFYRKYGRRVATRGYDDLFTPEQFGIKA